MEILAEQGCPSLYFFDDLGTAIDDEDQIFQIMASQEVASTTIFERFNFRREKVRCLRELGFSEDHSEGAPLCRWVHSGTILDLMPLDERILGFSNRWYPVAMDAANMYQLLPDLEIRVVTAVCQMQCTLHRS